ncbi:MAG TPA: hypothetical protein DCP08_03620 [Chloroflexi bacterium]|nr:hypothetical protein [Chloroflexota bacterium]
MPGGDYLSLLPEARGVPACGGRTVLGKRCLAIFVDNLDEEPVILIDLFQRLLIKGKAQGLSRRQTVI